MNGVSIFELEAIEVCMGHCSKLASALTKAYGVSSEPVKRLERAYCWLMRLWWEIRKPDEYVSFMNGTSPQLPYIAFGRHEESALNATQLQDRVEVYKSLLSLSKSLEILSKSTSIEDDFFKESVLSARSHCAEAAVFLIPTLTK